MSPYLFAMSMDVSACGIKDISSWCMIFADDIVLRSTRREEVEKKLRQECSLKLYWHVLRREEYYLGKRMMVMKVSWKIRRGSPKRKWSDNIRNDLC